MSDGLSMIVNTGGYGGFYARKGPVSLRICLGWIAVTFIARDIDNVLMRWWAAMKFTETVNKLAEQEADNRVDVPDAWDKTINSYSEGESEKLIDEIQESLAKGANLNE